MKAASFSGILSRRHAPIVVVEDEPDDLTSLRLLLETADIRRRVVAFGDAQQAVFHFRHIAGAPAVIVPCVVFVNLHMATSDGLEVIAAIRKDPAYSEVFIVGWSGPEQREDELRARAVGANACMKKFPTPQVLRALLRVE